MKKILYKELISSIKTPFYVFDERGFISNYEALQKAMRAVYPKYTIAYSYKTNYTPYICELVKRLGGYAEVVSDMEYTLAKKLGYSNDRIVYNGPAKGECLDMHLLQGGLINIDSLDEAKRVKQLAKDNPSHLFKVGFRINLDIGENFISRFGMSPDSEELDEAIKRLNNCANLQIVGVHGHISRSRSLEAWARRAEIMLDAADKYINGIPEYISLGSGMFADMPDELKAQFGDVPTYEDYARVTMQPFANRYKDTQPIVFTEPGTTIVARYLDFITRILSIKKIRGRYMATMDGSYENLGEICTLKKLPIKVVKSHNGKHYNSIDIVGYTCLEQDIMYSGYSGKLGTGDVLVFENVGGYSIVSKPQFILPNCSMVAYESDGTVKEIMRHETFDDVFSKFVFSEN